MHGAAENRNRTGREQAQGTARLKLLQGVLDAVDAGGGGGLFYCKRFIFHSVNFFNVIFRNIVEKMMNAVKVAVNQ